MASGEGDVKAAETEPQGVDVPDAHHEERMVTHEGEIPDTPKPITMVALDGSPCSYYALKWYLGTIIDLPQGVLREEIVIFNVMDPISLPMPGPFLYTTEWHQIALSEQKAARDKMKGDCRAIFEELGVKSGCIHFNSVIAPGPGATMCHYLGEHREIGHVVMGTRGLGMVRRTLVGSVSDYMVHHAHVPITIVPNPEKQ